MRLSEDNSNQSVVIDADPETVWDAIVDGGWLDDDREKHVEVVEEHRRMVWWWGDEEGFSRVEVELEPCVSGTRVVVTESFPLPALVSCFASVA